MSRFEEGKYYIYKIGSLAAHKCLKAAGSFAILENCAGEIRQAKWAPYWEEAPEQDWADRMALNLNGSRMHEDSIAIAKALRAVRDQALDQAAEIVFNCSTAYTMLQIRELKDKEPPSLL